MATWADLTTADPVLAATLRTLICQYGPGLGYLATIRPDGGPRIHPVSPVITDEGLYCFVLPSPKQHDLDRDGRYCLHSFPAEDSDDEAYLSGQATRVTDQTLISQLATRMRAAPDIDWHLYELALDVAMLVHHDSPSTSTRTVWKPRRHQIPNGPCETPVDSVQ